MVTLLARNEEPLRAACEELPGTSHYVVADLTNATQLKAAVADAVSKDLQLEDDVASENECFFDEACYFYNQPCAVSVIQAGPSLGAQRKQKQSTNPCRLLTL